MSGSRLAIAGFAALVGLMGVARADTLTIDMDEYASTVDPTPGVVLAAMTVKDLLGGGGVSVEVTLENAAQYFAATGGPHITLAFNVDKTITYSDFTFTGPSKSKFDVVTNTDGGPTFGTFTDGIQGTWNGTSNHFAGPITFTIKGLTVGDFGANTKNYWAIADVLGPKPNGQTGEIGGHVGAITSVPEPSTWAMMLAGFAGLGFAGYRASRRGVAAA